MYKNINKKMSESIETILINIVRDSNSHMDKINNSVLSNNKLLQTLIEKVSKVEEENKYLREKMEMVHELVNTNKVLIEKIETLEKPKPITKKPSKVPKEPKVVCSMTTAKGNQCTKPCIQGETCCTLHMKMRDKKSNTEQPVKKRPVLKKKKKEVPVHNHKPGETPTETCELCETHGDIFDPDMPETEFEESQDNDMSIEEKLRKMLEEEGEN
jgi:hypothetical protein